MAASAEVEEAWRAESATGAAAIRDGRVVGYLIGAPLDAKIWGQNVWVGLAGHAVEEPEDLRDLYAAAAERWVEDGRSAPVRARTCGDPALVDAWYRVGFGQQHAHGLQEIATAGGRPSRRRRDPHPRPPTRSRS